jgi:site-specific DNA-cytosine methylase
MTEADWLHLLATRHLTDDYAICRAIPFALVCAINHDAEALAKHAVDHREIEHPSKNIWQVDPMDVVDGWPVGLAWFSPDCKHFSDAKGRQWRLRPAAGRSA